MTGRIVKGIAGSYYVHDTVDLYECSARGIFRKNREKPLPGDMVRFEVISEAEKTGQITAILERRNRLLRPEVANVDQVLLVFAAASPDPNMEMLNRYLVTLQIREIPAVLAVNKIDLSSPEACEKLRASFVNTGYPMFFLSVKEGRGITELEECLKGKVTARAGPSGVGKSSLLNALLKRDTMETGELSRKISRGKNTTRHSEIFYLGDGGYLFDTPGFTMVEPDDLITENLPLYFPEFLPYIGQCRFNSCMHRKEPDCAVKAAVREGKISKDRYESYLNICDYLSSIRRY